MTKHSQAAEGDRHVPVDRSFANAAARLAYAYTSNDVGKWYKDSDTKIVWELTSSYLPGFSQITAVGAALYNFPFKVITVDLNEPSADYNNIASAIAAAVSGDVISIGPGTYTCDNQTLPAGVDLVGYGIGITILSTTGVTALNVGSDSHVADVTIISVNAAGNSYPIIVDGEGSFFDGVQAEATDDDGGYIANGFQVSAASDAIMLSGCKTAVSGGTSYGVYSEGTGVELHQGIYNAGNISVYANGGDITLVGPQLLSSPHAITAVSGGTVYGSYFDGDGNIVVGRYETGDLPTPGRGGRLMYDISTGHLVLDVGLSLVDYAP